ncbi:hypothetical protein ACFWFX_18720 [Streptomyces roseolus]|uniref:hypothetical protein n=1 Tax=Streptomyces roseolus TaxID=67358 RepID=UPI00364C47D9
MTTYPFHDGDVTVLGPTVVASRDGRVLNWGGVNYLRQGPTLAELRRDVHEALVVLSAPEAERIRGLIARLEEAVRTDEVHRQEAV